MIKEVNLPSGNYLFVEVPDDSYDFEIIDNDGLIYWVKDCVESTNLRTVSLEKADYKIISTTNDITEEQCESIVGKKFGDGYYQFIKEGMMRVASMRHSFPFDTAKESLQSLIQANNLNIENNYLIIQKL